MLPVAGEVESTVDYDGAKAERDENSETEVIFLRDVHGAHVMLVDKQRMDLSRVDHEDSGTIHKLEQSRNKIMKNLKILEAEMDNERKKREVIKLICDFFKFGSLHINDRNVKPMLETANEFDLPSVHQGCMVLLSRSISIANWPETLQAARQSQSSSLRRQVLAFLAEYLEECFQEKDLLSTITSLAWSTEDFESFHFLLRGFLMGKGVASSRKKFLNSLQKVFRKDMLASRCYFKEYLHTAEKELEYKEESIDDLKQHVVRRESETKKQRCNSNVRNDFCNTNYKGSLTNQKQYRETHAIDEDNTKGRETRTKSTPTELQENELKPLSQRTKLHRSLKSEESNVSFDSLKSTEKPVSKDTRNNKEARGKSHEKHDFHIHQLPREKTIILSGGLQHGGSEAIDYVFSYCPREDRWDLLPSMTNPSFNHAMVAIDNSLYVIGGSSGLRDDRQLKDTDENYTDRTTGNNRKRTPNTELNEMVHSCDRKITMPSGYHCEKQSTAAQLKSGLDDFAPVSSTEKLSPFTRSWQSVSSMILPREELCTVCFGGHVYAIGGHDGVGELCSVEKYDPKTDEWSLESPMPALRSGASAVTDGKLIYVIGGFDGKDYLSSVISYSPDTKVWTSDGYPPMKERRAYAGAVVFGERIFTIGGLNETTYLMSCEMFSLKTRTWTTGPSMNIARMNAAVCVFKRKIFVLGGESNGQFLDSVECLTLGCNQWQCISKMPLPAAGLCCTVYSPLLKSY